MNEKDDSVEGKHSPVVSKMGKLLDVRLGRILKWMAGAGVVLAFVAVIGFGLFVLYPTHSIPAYEPVDRYVYLNQGWGETRETQGRQTYYYTGQGTSLPQGNALHPLRYSWFVNLEMPWGKKRFADPEHMRAYRFIVDPAPTPSNPDQLPVGFARHFSTVVNEEVLDLTCAACHTGQLHYEKDGERVAIRIDGGQAMHAFADMGRGNFAPTLLASMIATYTNPLKFKRFARKVLGDGFKHGKDNLHRELGNTIRAFAAMGQNSPLRHLYPTQEGFGRTDALGRIANTVFGDHLVPGNYHTGGAPVSYPYVWNIWKFDWVQYNGSVSQPLARNIGEALGVGASINLIDANGQAIPTQERFSSSVNVPNLINIENTLQALTPPSWPEDIFGAIDDELASRGKELFEERCQGCHGPHVADEYLQAANAPGKNYPGLEWKIEVIPVEHIGTDPTATVGFADRRYDLTAAGLTDAEVRDLLRPIRIRKLLRDVQYRLRSIVTPPIDRAQPISLVAPTFTDASTAFAEVLAAYPDPETMEEPVVNEQLFKRMTRQATAALKEQPVFSVRQTPANPEQCNETCHLEWLLWLTKFGQESIEQQMDEINVASVNEGAGLNIIGLLIKQKYYKDHNISLKEQQCLEGFGTLDLPQVIAGYKPRPLQGVWATPPFLHNGSVPTIYQMLLPQSERDKKFFVGRRDYDPKHLGYVTAPRSDDEKDGFWLDTSIVGNLNTGHQFVADPETWKAHRADPKANPLPSGVIGPLFNEEDRMAILEYLKIHVDTPQTPADFAPIDCSVQS